MQYKGGVSVFTTGSKGVMINLSRQDNFCMYLLVVQLLMLLCSGQLQQAATLKASAALGLRPLPFRGDREGLEQPAAAGGGGRAGGAEEGAGGGQEAGRGKSPKETGGNQEEEDGGGRGRGGRLHGRRDSDYKDDDDDDDDDDEEEDQVDSDDDSDEEDGEFVHSPRTRSRGDVKIDLWSLDKGTAEVPFDV